MWQVIIEVTSISRGVTDVVKSRQGTTGALDPPTKVRSTKARGNEARRLIMCGLRSLAFQSLDHSRLGAPAYAQAEATTLLLRTVRSPEIHA